MNEATYIVRGQGDAHRAAEQIVRHLYQLSYKDSTGGDMIYEIKIQPVTGGQRTPTQNASLHLFFTLCATALNAAGLDQKKVLAPGADIPWTPQAFKENVWRPVQKAMYGEESTARMKKKHYLACYG